MTDSHSRTRVNLSPEDSERIDRICDAFETAWKRGTQPQIEAYLARLPAAAQAVGLLELIALEVELRNARDETVDQADYIGRFSQDTSTVKSAFDLVRSKLLSGQDHGDTASMTGSTATRRRYQADAESDASDFADGDELTEAALVSMIPIDYEFRQYVGRGGMGWVVRARHRALDRDVAIKFIRAGRSKERFLRESRLLAKIRSPYVVAVNDFQVLESGMPMLVMEWVEGNDLGRVLRKPRTEVNEYDALKWMRQTCEGMLAAEKEGIIHRDLKPSNIIIDRAGNARVVDFGLARSHQVLDDLSRSSALMGTPYYMAPEQAEDPSSVDVRADVYSFGATFYHVLSGHPPFDGSTPFSVLFKHKTETLKSLRETRPDLSDRMVDVVERSLAKAPASRFPSFRAILQLLAEPSDVIAPWSLSDDEEVGSYMKQYRERQDDYLDRLAPKVGDLDTYTFPRGQKIIIRTGDIVHETVDAVVSSDTAALQMEYGVSRAIGLAAGQRIVSEARQLAPVRPGRAAVTSAGKLHARLIFHGVTVGVVGSKIIMPSRDLITEIMASCFYQADAHDVRTIGFPLLGTGAMGFAQDICLETMFQFLIRTFLHQLTGVREARIVLFRD